MFYHASPVKNIAVLEPRISNHGKAQVYFSEKRENVLVYLSNAVEKYCKEQGYDHQGPYRKWASYGFTKEGILRLEEYYPNATEETYKGVSGWIYWADKLDQGERLEGIPFVWTSSEPVAVSGCTYIPDAYEAIMEAVREGKMVLKRYEDCTESNLRWIRDSARQEYAQAENSPEYRLFLKTKFGDLLD